MTDVEQIATKDGFTFKRKRKEPEEINPIKKVKLTVDPPKEILGCSRKSILKTSIPPGKQQVYSTGNNTSTKPSESKDVDIRISIGNIKPQGYDSTSKLHEEKITLENSKKKAENEIQPENKKKVEPVSSANNQIVLYKPTTFQKLASYPERKFIMTISPEIYEKIDPFRRLIEFFNEMNISEKQHLQKEYEGHKEFLGIVEKFSGTLKKEIEVKWDQKMKEKGVASKVVKENLQNVFNQQKNQVVRKMIQEYNDEMKSMDKYEEEKINSGKCDKIIANYVTTFDGNNKLVLEPHAIKAVDSNREQIEQKIATKFKSALTNIYQFERDLDEVQHQVKYLRKDMNNDSKTMHDRIFQTYVPVLNMNSGVLINNFLTTGSG